MIYLIGIASDSSEKRILLFGPMLKSWFSGEALGSDLSSAPE